VADEEGYVRDLRPESVVGLADDAVLPEADAVVREQDEQGVLE
jgi:hypothetical protein